MGTKIDLANQFNKYDTIGIDLVAMCVNDLIVQGAKPLFFLDYIAVEKIKFNKLKKILNGIVKGCNISDCSLIGGETAEMPGIYDNNKFDLAGFSGCIVSKKKIIHKKNMENWETVIKVTNKHIQPQGEYISKKPKKKEKISKNFKKKILTHKKK